MKKALFILAAMFATSIALNTAIAQSTAKKTAAPAKDSAKTSSKTTTKSPTKTTSKAPTKTTTKAPTKTTTKAPAAATTSATDKGASSISNTATTSGAKIEFEKDFHDYGDVKYGADGTCTFEFKNTGNAPLIISEAHGSCGCTVPEWPKEPINPGQKAQLKVKYDTTRIGAINKTVTVTSNAVNEPSKVVSIKGTVGAKPESSAPVNNATGPVNN